MGHLFFSSSTDFNYQQNFKCQLIGQDEPSYDLKND